MSIDTFRAFYHVYCLWTFFNPKCNEFKRAIEKNLFYKIKKKFDKDKYCLKSDKVSDRVFNYYKKVK